MNLIKTKAQLFQGISEPLAGHNFFFNKDEENFQRVFDGGSQTFYFLITKNNNEIYVQPRWSIRLKEILDIYHQITIKGKEFFKDSSVLENSLGELIEFSETKNEESTNKSMKYVIKNEEDIEVLKNVIPIRFEEYVLPYFELNSTVARVDILLNTNPRLLIIHNWLYPHRALMGLIAAKLADNPKFHELVAIYEEELAQANPRYKQEFRNLKILFKIN